jgi:hypothetical protein
MYGAVQYFVPNALSRYALGERSGLTFPSGSPVYPDKGDTADAPFEFLLQPADITPRAN